MPTVAPLIAALIDRNPYVGVAGNPNIDARAGRLDRARIRTSSRTGPAGVGLSTGAGAVTDAGANAGAESGSGVGANVELMLELMLEREPAEALVLMSERRTGQAMAVLLAIRLRLGFRRLYRCRLPRQSLRLDRTPPGRARLQTKS